MSWEATYMPAISKSDPSKGGFTTSEEAWEYASQYFCDDCKKLFDNGKGSNCDAEWIIDEEEIWPPEVSFVY
jgi:hypothetical protein